MRFRSAFPLLVLFLALPSIAQAQLRIVSAGPEGELQTLEQANEVRVVFSEPMVVIGTIPQPVRVPFFRIDPAIAGVFRWSGTNTLIFRPDPKALRYATSYAVTIDASATSIHGTRLAAPHTLRFTTPTLRLQNTRWYRRDNGAVVLGLEFNQPVDRSMLLPHVDLALESHDPQFEGIQTPGAAATAVDPNAIRDFRAKRSRVEAASRSTRKVLGFIPAEWDEERIPDARNTLVIETQPDLPAGAWVKITIDSAAPSPGGSEVPGFQQDFVAMLGPGFFVRRSTCVKGCNPDWRHRIELTEDAELEDLASAITVTDITDRTAPRLLAPTAPRQDEETGWAMTSQFALEDLGYRIEPAHTYRVVLPKTLVSAGGEPLGYTWAVDMEYWHRVAYSSFGEGHGVWEPDGGPLVPFWARNLRTVHQWTRTLGREELMPVIIRNEDRGFRITPAGPPVVRELRPVPDELQSYGLDAGSILGADNRGLFWAAIQEGDAIPKSERLGEDGGKVQPKSTIIQATDIGLTVKHSPVGALVWATRLSDGAPVAGAAVEIRDRDNNVNWTGTTDADGIAIAPDFNLRREWWNTEFIAIAEKEGDVAYVASNWNQGILPWFFDLSFDPEPKTTRLRGSLFTDRGVYRPGEEIQTKVILRNDTATGMELYPAGTEVALEVRNPRSDVVGSARVPLSAWSSAEWAWKIPANAVLGSYSVHASPGTPDEAVVGSFLVAAYRRPDFRVDVELGSAEPVAGTPLEGAVEARYLFGAPMSGLPVRWRYFWRSAWQTPAALQERFPARDFVWTDECGLTSGSAGENVVREEEGRLGPDGVLRLELETDLDAGAPREYTLEGEVTDVTRQAIAGRASFLVHPAPWYIGLLREETFFEAADGLTTQVVAATPLGTLMAGVEVDLTLVQIQWHSVRRAEGRGFYTWETEEREVPSGSWKVITRSEPVPLDVPVPRGGYYRLIARASEAGRTTTTCFGFYAAGEGYTAWERYDHNRIELVPEKTRYAPGETARLLVKSPWESAMALVTTEREGIRSHRTFALDSTQEEIEIPITEADIPNVFVSVVLVKGRTEGEVDEAGTDPGKPAFRVGYAEIKVDDETKRLSVELDAPKEDLEPGSKATIGVEVRDAAGRPADAEVTLWAVDYGVLSLTGYATPEVLESVWVDEPLQVITADSRQKIIARRVLTPKGAGVGGGGGAELGADAMRSDFRPLAFWIGSVETGPDGNASVEVTLPDSLTTYRIMAVAADRESRFGSAEEEIRTSRPVLLRPTFPRFLAVGDEATFGAVVNSRLTREASGTVIIRALDPEILGVVGDSGRRIRLQPAAQEEIRFNAIARAPGVARFEMLVRLGNETDSFRAEIPVLLPVSPEVVASYGSVPPDGSERLAIPAGVLPQVGGLRIELASTALVGLQEGARYLVEYPYGCAEQRASALFAMLTATELGSAFEIPELEWDRELLQTRVEELEQFQCDSGGFAFWKGNCSSASPYITAWLVHVLHLARELGYEPRAAMLERAYDYLQFSLAQEPEIGNENALGTTAWQAFAIRELAAGGRNVDAELGRAWRQIDRAPIFALAWLHDALVDRGEAKAARAVELRRRIQNSILREAGASHVEELQSPILDFLWSTSTRSTAIVLRTLVEAEADQGLIQSMVRWLLEARRDGRWGSTQENAWALEALVAYFRKYESEVPDFAATVTLGDEAIVQQEFRGRTTESEATELPMTALIERGGGELPLIFSKEGAGTLHYGARLEYARPVRDLLPLDQGFTIERSYAPAEGAAPAAAGFAFDAGDLIRVTLRIRVPKERIWVAVSDPIPAGLEPVEGWFRTTASDLASVASVQGEPRERRDGGRGMQSEWFAWFERGGFDHIEKHDDRVDLFATRLGEGEHVFSYLARATTSGTFVAAPTRAEEMYRPENFGRGAVANVTITP